MIYAKENDNNNNEDGMKIKKKNCVRASNPNGKQNAFFSALAFRMCVCVCVQVCMCCRSF